MRLHFRILLFIIFFLWCAGIFSQYLIYFNEDIVYLLPFLKKSYSIVCHQENHKLIKSDGFEALVCARCTGIYIGLLFASGVVLFLKSIKNMRLKYFFLFSLPMILDVLFTSIGFYNYSKYIAFITGMLFGSAGFSYFYNSLNDLLIEFQTRK